MLDLGRRMLRCDDQDGEFAGLSLRVSYVTARRVLVVRRSGVQWDGQAGGGMGAASKAVGARGGSGVADAKSYRGRAALVNRCIDISCIRWPLNIHPSCRPEAARNVTAAILPACPRLCPACLANTEISI